jgi:hypothetical protein
MTLTILIVINLIINLINLVLTVVNIIKINEITYDLVNDMVNTELDELSEEFEDFFRGE